MAYASLLSLLRTLRNLSDYPRFQIPYPNPQIQTLTATLVSLQSSVESIFPVTKSIKKDVDTLESQIRDAVFKSQDSIESFMSNLLVSPESVQLPGDLTEVIKSFDEIEKKAMELASFAMEINLGTKYGNLSEEAIPSKFTSRSKTTKIIGQEEDFRRVTEELVSKTDDLLILPIIGMPGIGKTTLARSVYEDRRMEEIYLARAWVTVSAEYNFGDIFTKLLASIETRGQNWDGSLSSSKISSSLESYEALAERLYQTLFDTRYLVVIDDLWAEGVWDRLKQYFPDNKNGSRIIITTRHENVAAYVKPYGFRCEMKLLNAENSWELLCYRVFGDGVCPPNLESIGRKISENCGGLPLSLIVIGGQLSQERKTVEYWKVIEEDIHTAGASASKDANPYLEILTLSYSHLPIKLKGCFLYMGAFPKDSEILISKLIRLWVAEGILEATEVKSFELVAKDFLIELIDRNLLMAHKFGPDGLIKSCGIHNVLRDIAVQECRKERFFHGIESYDDKLEDGVETQRRLSVHNNVLMCMEEVYNSTLAVEFARSFLFTGNHHHHPYPFSLAFKYLRVLDALTLYFIDFPNEVINMIHLSYLSLTYNGKLPSEIAKLRNLQVLIVRRHPKVIFLGTPLLPDEIWCMSQLRHLFVTETELPKISGVEFFENDSPLLGNLQSLTNVNALCCTKEVLARFPNLTMLETWVEEPCALEFHINKLEDLEVFKFTVLNPDPDSKIDFLPELAFPKMLRKLSLSGCGIPWEDMTIIGQLEHLEVLKLRQFAFHGSKGKMSDEESAEVGDEESAEEGDVSVWIPQRWEFQKLKYLLLEALDLDVWIADDTHFPVLENLIIRHCYNLEEIPIEIGDILPLELMEMIDCSPNAVESAHAIKKRHQNIRKMNNIYLQVRIYSSWQ